MATVWTSKYIVNTVKRDFRSKKFGADDKVFVPVQMHQEWDEAVDEAQNHEESCCDADLLDMLCDDILTRVEFVALSDKFGHIVVRQDDGELIGYRILMRGNYADCLRFKSETMMA